MDTTPDLLLEMLRGYFRKKNSSANFLYPKNEKVLRLAYQHGIGLIIGSIMQLDRKERLVNHILAQKNVKRYYENFIHFNPVSQELEKDNIKYIITKGVYIAKKAYLDEGYRSSEDLDVIIKREDYSKVKEFLLLHGYKQAIYDQERKEIVEFSRQQELFYLSFTQQSAPFLKITGNDLVPVVNIDLNFSIYWDKNQEWNIDKLINNAQVFKYKGYKVKTFQDEYMLLHMCLHAYYDLNSVYVLYKSYSYRLKYFADIYGFVQHVKISWEKFQNICIVYKVEKYIMYILFYTARIFHDKTLLSNMDLEIPSDFFLNSFGLANEGEYVWRENFMERLFCGNRENLINKYLLDEIKNKINQGRYLEGL